MANLLSKISLTRRVVPKSLRGKALLAVGSYIGLSYVLALLFWHFDKPKVQYNLKRLDCGKEAILERNTLRQTPSNDSCIIIIQATNLKEEAQYVDWDGVGGGPLAGWHPMIKIHARDDNFCYAAVDKHEDIPPKGSLDLTLECFSNEESIPNYDTRSDTQPLYIEIKNSPITRLYPNTAK